MAIYKGEVVTTTDDDFPFAAIISNQDGNVVSEYPVRTRADGEAKSSRFSTASRNLPMTNPMLRELRTSQPT